MPNLKRAYSGLPSPPEARPLYVQVKEVMIRRMVDGQWRPGQALPNEQQLAAELGVSQGTVRKALDDLAMENVVVRQQGKGTFVAEHTQQRMLFQFFNLVDDRGERQIPDSELLACGSRPATATEARRLGLAKGATVIAIRRLRRLGGEPVIIETLVVDRALFPDLGAEGSVPNTLYDLYQSRYGITVAKAKETLTARAASAADAAALGLAEGQPLLEIDRLAYGLDGRLVEWRVSRCHTSRYRYLSELA
jgi:GntR family transcriptional regulator